VSRFGFDDDDQQYDEVRPNATCTDCGMDFSRAYDDQGRCCDGCSDRRDAHTDALEIRLASDGQPDVVPFVDVAIVPADPAAAPGPILEIALEWNPAWDAVRRPVPEPVVPRRAAIVARLPTLSAVQASRAGKPLPKASTRRQKRA
jgi:hypothetical protein